VGRLCPPGGSRSSALAQDFHGLEESSQQRRRQQQAEHFNTHAVKEAAEQTPPKNTYFLKL